MIMAEENKKVEESKPAEVTSEATTDEKVKVEANKDEKDVTPGTNVKKVPEEKKVTVADNWVPRTELGRKVKKGEITDIEKVLDSGMQILEAEIVEILVPNIESDLLLIGQSKGKFGGGQRRVFRQTQKKTKEGNKPKFATFAVVGNKDGIVGVGYGKAKETVPAREKAFRNAKLNVIKIRRGCGSWESINPGPNSVPFRVEGKCGSVKVALIPAPPGKGLVIEKECQKILKMAGINDVWSKTSGQTSSKINLVKACFNALKQLMDTKVQPNHVKQLGIAEGRIGE